MDQQNTNQQTDVIHETVVDETTDTQEMSSEVMTPEEESVAPVQLEEVDLGEDDEVQTTADLSSTNAAMSILEIETIINRFLGDQEKLKETMKAQKEMYNASFENDAEYAGKNEEMKKLKKEVAAIKQRIVKLPEVVVVNNRINELKEEMKDIQEALTGYLQQYQQVSGTNQFMTEDGEVIEIVNVLKLVRKGSRG